MLNNRTRQSLMLRLPAGALFTVLSVAGFAWILQSARVDDRFHSLPPLTDNQTDVQFLSWYSVQLEPLLANDPYDGVIRKRYATVLARLGQNERAMEQLDRAVRTSNTPESFFFRADMFAKLGNLSRAEEGSASPSW